MRQREKERERKRGGGGGGLRNSWKERLKRARRGRKGEWVLQISFDSWLLERWCPLFESVLMLCVMLIHIKLQKVHTDFYKIRTEVLFLGKRVSLYIQYRLYRLIKREIQTLSLEFVPPPPQKKKINK